MIHALFALLIFAVVYGIVLAGETAPRKLDRPAAGLIGAVLMVLCGVLSRNDALRAIDFPTLALLLGMMIVIHYATASGLLNHLARLMIVRSRNARQLLWMVCWASGLLSALFVNDTICLLMTPLLLAVCKRTRLPAEPHLLALATSSNVGSAMALTGNPQNMLIGQSSHWGWGAFALRMVPIGLICLLLNGWVVSFLYRKPLREARFAPISEEEADGETFHATLASKTLFVLAGLLMAFLCGAPMDLAALAAGAALLLLANRPAEEAFASVDWALLLFFAGLFVVVQGVTKTEGHWIARLLPAITRHPGTLAQLTGFSLASMAGSNLFSNVPFVMLLRGYVASLPHAPLLWLTLAASSTFAGNLTLVGSVANLIVAQKAQKEAPLTFGAFLRVGIPSTLLSTLASVVFLWLYGLFGWA